MPLNSVGLRCEYLVDPLGLTERRPRLSWHYASGGRGLAPVVVQVRVASNSELLEQGKPDLWDSGRMPARSTSVPYGGIPLRSRQRAYWQVNAWSDAKALPVASSIARFELGLLHAGDWEARWLSSDVPQPGSQPAVYLRAEVPLSEKPVKRARLYISAKGLYESSVNGETISEDFFRPGWTDYNRRIQFQAYDVGRWLKTGPNALGIILAEGWYGGHVCWFGRQQYGPMPAAIAQLEIEFEDGKTERHTTGDHWKWSYGPITSADLLMGEGQDMGKAIDGWDKPNFDATAWHKVHSAPFGQVPLVGQPCEPVRSTRELAVASAVQRPDGATIFDLGQNIVGFARLDLELLAESTVTVRHAEMLAPDGGLYLANLRGAKAIDTYKVPKGGKVTLEPKFTFHGFRYIEVQGAGPKPPASGVHGVVLGQELRETGTFECSNADLNHLHQNIVWGQRGNYLEVPTDCPQRDERLGWMGDAQIFARTAAFNMDIAAFMTKWLIDVSDAQTDEGAYPNVAPNTIGLGDGAPGWADAGLIVPWTLYRCYGDTRILARHYDGMRRYVDFVHRWNPDLMWKQRSSHNFGDWLSIEAPTPPEVLATAFFARSADLLSRMAQVLGRKEDAARYRELFTSIGRAFTKKFATKDGAIHGGTQTGAVLALCFDLLPERLRSMTCKKLVEDIERRGHLSTGFIGSGLLLPTLTRFGRSDVAYKLLLTDTFPSWLFSIRHGATTIWERWDGWTPEKGFQDPGMNSFNHYAFGAVGEWMTANILGIDLDEKVPGYAQIVFHPRMGGGITWARGSYDSIKGRIESDWRLEAGRMRYRVLVPPGSQGTVVLPQSDAAKVREGTVSAQAAEEVKHLRSADGESWWKVGSGEYAFECPA